MSSQLERACKEREVELTDLRESFTGLHRSLEERNAELELLQKRLNREVPVDGAQDCVKSSVTALPSKDLAAVKEEVKNHKEEIKGHKYAMSCAY